MVFTSYAFLFVFLPLLLLAYARAAPRHRLWVLTIASYVFYGWWRADFTLLLAFSTLVSWACGLGMARVATPRARGALLATGVVANLGLLAWFKYFDFVLENVSRLLVRTGAAPLTWEEVLLPVGISFFTFQTTSYLIDVHRGTVEPSRRLLPFACYVALFPQLVAGPIVRFREVAQDLAQPKRSLSAFASGAHLLLIGFNKKVLIADHLAVVVDRAFAATEPGVLDAWLGVTAFSFQIYFDFSAYSDIAVGLGWMLGLRFPMNFDSPYRAESVTEFWRRWHMTLSRWLRDYLYIPLGGNRRGPRRTYANLMATMLLGGLWHGAQWTFVLWGAYHGLLLALERRAGRRAPWRGLPRPARVAATWLVVTIGWVPFRADSLDGALVFGRALAGAAPWTAGALATVPPFAFAVLAAAALLAFFGIHSWRLAERPDGPGAWLQLAVFVIAVHELMARGVAPFLYFQF